MKHITHKLTDKWYDSIGFLWIFWPMELLYIFFVRCRRALYRLNILSIYRAPCPVVVVGNLTLGGSGKTPVVIELVRLLQEKGLKVGVLSRGYGGKVGSEPLIVNEKTKPIECGDEPILIFEKTNCPVAVYGSRSQAAQLLIREHAIDLILSDDGLQHYSLARDLEVVLIDEERGLGNCHCLPVGPLREPKDRLSSADLVIYRGGNGPMSFGYTLGDFKPVCISSSYEPLSKFPVSSVHAIAGIGQPEQFFSMLEGMGLLLTRFSYADHYQYQQSDFERHDGATVVMTEKDAVKCRDLNILDAWFVELKVSLPEVIVESIIKLLRPEDNAAVTNSKEGAA